MRRSRTVTETEHADRARGRVWMSNSKPEAIADFLTGFMPPWLSFSRAGNAMMYDATGKLTYAPNNLITHSNDLTGAATNANWVGVNITAGVNNITDDATSGAHSVQFPVTTVAAGNKYLLYVEAKALSLTKIMLNAINVEGKGVGFDLSDGTTFTVPGITLSNAYGITPLADGWFGCWIIMNSSLATTTNNGAIYLMNGTSFSYAGTGQTVNIRKASLTAVTYETTPRPGDQVITSAAAYYGPRFDYDPVTLAPKGLLLEGSMTNVGNDAGMGLSTLALNQAISPDGTVNAFFLAEDTSNPSSGGGHQCYFGTNDTPGSVTYCASVFLKKGTRTKARVYVCSNSVANGAYVDVDLASGTIIGNGVTGDGVIKNFGIIPLSDEWYRIFVSGTFTIFGQAFGDVLLMDDTGTPYYAGDGTSGLYFYLPQLETGTFMSSPIPAAFSASPMTRAADVAQFDASTTATFNSSVYSAFVEFQALPGFAATNPNLIGGASNSRHTPLYIATLNDASIVSFGDTYNTGPLQTNGTRMWKNISRMGVTLSSTRRALCKDGSAVASDANAPAGTETAYSLGSTGNAAFASGWYRSVAVGKATISDAKLQAMSVVGAPYQ